MIRKKIPDTESSPSASGYSDRRTFPVSYPDDRQFCI